MEKVKQNYSHQFTKMKKKNRYRENVNLIESTEIEDTIVTYKYFKNVTFNYIMDSISFDNCVFENCTFKANIKNCTFFNTKFHKCEMSNIMIMNTGIHSCLFDESHMVGINYVDTLLKNTDFLTCHMKLSLLDGVKIKDVSFKDSNMSSSSWTNVSLDNDEFDNIDFRKIEIINTPMNGVDISNCNIDGICILPENVKGMIVSEVQAIELINILGIVIK